MMAEHRPSNRGQNIEGDYIHKFFEKILSNNNNNDFLTSCRTTLIINL